MIKASIICLVGILFLGYFIFFYKPKKYPKINANKKRLILSNNMGWVKELYLKHGLLYFRAIRRKNGTDEIKNFRVASPEEKMVRMK